MQKLLILLPLLPLLIVSIQSDSIKEVYAQGAENEKYFPFNDMNNQKINSINESNSNPSFEYSKNTDVIKSNFLTYSNQSFNLKALYPDYWTISTIGNDALALISPLNFSGMLINKLDYHDLDEFLYDRINSQRNSLQEFQLIETYDIALKNSKEPKKALIYIFKDNDDSFKAVEIIFNSKSDIMYHISFVSNSSFFDTMIPSVNKILNSIEISTPKNEFDTSEKEVMNNSDYTDNQTVVLPNATDVIPLNKVDIDSTNTTEINNLEEIDPILTIPSGASTIGNPSYSPENLTTIKGKLITVVNTDSAPHTVTSGEGQHDFQSGQSFNTSTMLPGSNAIIDTSAMDAGEYQFHCSIHPFMKGSLVIAE